jgi:hypothetical protein
VAVANGVVSDDPSSPYAALHDVVGSATTLHAPSARFDGAVVVNFGADDSLAFEDAFSPAGFAYAGGFLTYDADGDGTVKATVLLTRPCGQKGFPKRHRHDSRLETGSQP